ncbi:Sodium/potassium/calcium exchanger 5 [Folsomia candida]|uniref:Sodium/potassium/calcium exchanger 5 n=1 Tax=Folsomia candida TaxID=158441 RepID=A0A226DNR8_FOLCA|nr:Sodium/potassium/calcium exchanger 5 [Folsomia candida]
MASRFVILLLLLFCSTSSIMGARTRTISALELLASARVLQNAIGNMDGWTATIQQNEVMPGKPEHFAGLKVSMDDELLSENTNFGRDQSTATGHETTEAEDLEECREPAIDEFPKDLFSTSELQSGWITIHILATLYLFYALAIVEIAGCTILGISNSSPELFTNVIATFVAKGDLGISSIVGASVFNLFAVAASIGIICRKTAAKIEWYPLSRDTFVYVISVSVLALILRDNHVHWYDGLLLVLLIHAFVKRMVRKVRSIKCFQGSMKQTPSKKGLSTASTFNSLNSVLSNQSQLDEDEEQPIPNEFDDETMPIWPLPFGESYLVWTKFIVGWPIRLLYKVTIPDCKLPTVRKWFPVTLLMCIVWNTILCYLLGWMVTVIGWTFGIPDTVMGITLFAMGTSVPQAVSSIIVARRGMGTMAMNNAIGSNIFNILVCLGAPWMIQTLILVGDSSANERYIVMNSRALGYTAFILIGCMIGLYLIIAANRFKIDLKVGIVALAGYLIAITVASLFELNVFMHVNPPLCKD